MIMVEHDKNMKRQVYFISDSTGITVEALGHSLLSQFRDLHFEYTTLRYIDSLNKVENLCQTVNNFAGEVRPLIFSTLVDGQLRAKLSTANAHVFDLMGKFLTPLEEVLSTQASSTLGHTHGQGPDKHYEHRMDAVKFALLTDDGITPQHLDRADIILIGPSRSGKTPTSLYLAMQYGVYAANYPLVEEDFELMRLPGVLAQRHDRLFGLSITAERLHHIREGRRPDSEYASIKQCQHEVRQIGILYRENRIPTVEVTQRSVEEIATRILPHLHLS